MFRGRVVGVSLENGSSPNPDLAVAARLPRLERVTFVHGRLTPQMVALLEPIGRPFDLIIDEPTAPPNEAAIDALAKVKTLRRLVLRGAFVGEDVVHRFAQRRPDVEVVLEPPAVSAESPQRGDKRVARPKNVQW